MGVAAGGPTPLEPVPLRRNRDFQLLWGGQAVSLLGSQTSKIAYPLLVLALTGSPAKAGIAGFAAMLGYLLFPLPAGGLADRHDRKRIMIVCDAVRLAAVGSIAVAGWAAHITYMQVLVAGFIEGTATVFFGVAQRAALPMLVHSSQRSVAVGQNEARQNAAQLAGPALGGAPLWPWSPPEWRSRPWRPPRSRRYATRAAAPLGPPDLPEPPGSPGLPGPRVRLRRPADRLTRPAAG